jgi:exodeoxyribonuclease VII large subunit
MNEEHPILTVSQLSQAIKQSIEEMFPLIWLRGEISNFKPHSSGHLYFNLKDANAQISAIMFRADAAQIKVPFKDGTEVIVRGELNVYPTSGKYQIVIKELRPIGLGELLLKLEELKIKLNKMGWFKTTRKRPLPKFPKTIGVVTSPTGAVIQDILNILSRRFSGFHLILNPVKVQGEGAAKEIAQAIKQFNDYQLADVLIVGRGGGSIEDLWAFNEEIVAESIFNSQIPIISAVGHETDHCIADYVADVRAPTPSAAAEIVIAEKSQQFTHLMQMQQRMQQTVTQLIRQDRHRLQGVLRHPLMQSPYGLLGQWLQRLDIHRQSIDDKVKTVLYGYRIRLEAKKQELYALKPSAKLEHYRQKLAGLNREIHGAMSRKLNLAQQMMLKLKQIDEASFRALMQAKKRLDHIKMSIDLVNPKNLLQKGYCILFSEKENRAVSSVKNAVKGEDYQLFLSDGQLIATIKQ